MPFAKKPIRSTETRAANSRPEGWVKPGTQLELGIGKDPDYAYRWNRLYITGAEIDRKSQDKRRQEGWRNVEPSELPDLAGYVTEKGIIFKDGNVLQKLPIDHAKAYVDYYEQMALGNVDGHNEAFKRDRDKYVSKTVETGKQRIFRGELPPNA